MRTLVTGAAGFVGRHLVRHLSQNGHEVDAFDLHFSAPLKEARTCSTGDLRDPDALNNIVRSMRPEACIHLGAISFVPSAGSDPDAMLSVNIHGTINLLNALRDHAPASRLLVVSTSHVYGMTDAPEPRHEDSPLLPVSLYAISKAASDLATLSYAAHYGLHALTARACNHTGPGQSSKFVVPAFAEQAKAIAAGTLEPILKVGNLDSERHFMDVRDVTRAYRQLVEKGRPGQAYNIASRDRISIRAVLKTLCDLAEIQPEIEVDPAKFRPTDKSPLLDATRLESETGWKPEIDLADTLRDILAEY